MSVVLFSLQDKPSKEVLKIIAGLVPMRQSVSISKHLGVKWEQNSTLDILKYWYKGKGILDGKPVPVTYLVLFKALEDSSNAGNFKLALVKLQNSKSMAKSLSLFLLVELCIYILLHKLIYTYYIILVI